MIYQYQVAVLKILTNNNFFRVVVQIFIAETSRMPMGAPSILKHIRQGFPKGRFLYCFTKFIFERPALKNFLKAPLT